MKKIYATLTHDGEATGFYRSDIHGDAIPADAVEISEQQWMDLLDGGSGRIFVGGAVVDAPKHKTLAAARTEALQNLKKLRIEKTEAGIIFGGRHIPTDAAALGIIQTASMFVSKNPNKTLKKAGLGEFNAAALDGLINAVGDMQRPIYAHESDLYDQIMACTTIEQILAIDITVGWPEA